MHSVPLLDIVVWFVSGVSLCCCIFAHLETKEIRYALQHMICREKLFSDALHKHYEDVDRFNEWRVRNPGKYVSKSDFAIMLVMNMIESYHTMIQYSFELSVDEKYLALLHALLNEGPPPKLKPTPSSKPSYRGLLILFTIKI